MKYLLFSFIFFAPEGAHYTVEKRLIGVNFIQRSFNALSLAHTFANWAAYSCVSRKKLYAVKRSILRSNIFGCNHTFAYELVGARTKLHAVKRGDAS